MTRRKQSVLVGLQVPFPQSMFFHLDRGDLDRICAVLNRKPKGQDGREKPTPEAQALILLIERLKQCDGNLKKMMDGDPELAKAVAEVCVTRWMPSTNRTAHLVLQSSEKHLLKRKRTPEQMDRMRPERFAALLFHVGTLNPDWDKLAGPCARCGNYYIKKRESQKVYCSRRCGNAATAVERTRQKLQQEREDKIKRVKAAIRKWRSAMTQQDWKSWVAQTTKIDPRFLTRAVGKGDLVPPTRRRKA